ncbi:MAG TPA: universal stress protein [Jatrophihabitans sp.]|jgi:nucleotide-binding universal stress UspA family protein|uniref:universal stress protein n=1 Tax=Jatrophihabitans sp. TaxID=1932789 RepID=UPI002E0AEC7E|nr:universal stress protein [Jatrophihabitans sp.]
MTATAPGSVVVGVSPRTGSPAALSWASTYAALRKTTVTAVLAWRPARPPAAPGGRPPGSLLSGDLPDPEREAEARLASFVAAALGPDHGVQCRVLRRNEVSALLECGAGAELIVLGEPSPGRLASVRAGLVAPQVIRRARCPVVVMPGTLAAN